MIKKQLSTRLQYNPNFHSVLEVNYNYNYIIKVIFDKEYLYSTILIKDVFDLVLKVEDLRTLEEDTFFQKSIAHDLPVPLELIRSVQNFIPNILTQYKNCDGIRVDYYEYTFEY